MILYKYFLQEQDKVVIQNKYETAFNVSESPKPLLFAIFGIAFIHSLISQLTMLFAINAGRYLPNMLLDSLALVFYIMLTMPSEILFMFTGWLWDSSE